MEFSNISLTFSLLFRCIYSDPDFLNTNLIGSIFFHYVSYVKEGPDCQATCIQNSCHFLPRLSIWNGFNLHHWFIWKNVAVQSDSSFYTSKGVSCVFATRAYIRWLSHFFLKMGMKVQKIPKKLWKHCGRGRKLSVKNKSVTPKLKIENTTFCGSPDMFSISSKASTILLIYWRKVWGGVMVSLISGKCPGQMCRK